MKETKRTRSGTINGRKYHARKSTIEVPGKPKYTMTRSYLSSAPGAKRSTVRQSSRSEGELKRSTTSQTKAGRTPTGKAYYASKTKHVNGGSPLVGATATTKQVSVKMNNKKAWGEPGDQVKTRSKVVK